ncbi:MAG: 2-oxoglutarate synthase, partial [Rhodospirillales bacterium]|nr:2-oxoglutarate synthase [Rhodospirillales bacterium]
MPSQVTGASARVLPVPMKDMAKSMPEGRANMIALGIAGQLLGMAEDVWPALLAKRLEGRGQATIDGSLASLKAGYEAARGIGARLGAVPRTGTAGKRWLVSGNEAAALGAIRGGIRFAA